MGISILNSNQGGLEKGRLPLILRKGIKLWVECKNQISQDFEILENIH
jgi:hypothetical protein